MPDDAVGAVAELAASQHGAITRRQAAAIGFSRARVATAKRNGWLSEPTPGVLTHAAYPDSWRQRMMICTLAGGNHAVASHRAAAYLHELDGFGGPPGLEVSTVAPRCLRLPAHLDAVLHRVSAIDRCDVITIDGIRTTGLARTLADLGTVCEPSVVRRALTDARRRSTSLGWLRATAERLHRPGQAGTSTLLRLLDAVPIEGRVPDSWFEELIALSLADPELPDAVPQYVIRDRDGRHVARVDLAFPSVRVGLEAHSRRFHFGPDAEPLDEQRDLAAAACGWELLYLGWYATRRPQELLTVVRRVVAARANASKWRPGRRSCA